MSRLTTGDAELDAILGGGLPEGSLIVLAGAPGSGKTILAQQICFANATDERKAIYYTTWSEPHDKLVRHLDPDPISVDRRRVPPEPGLPGREAQLVRSNNGTGRNSVRLRWETSNQGHSQGGGSRGEP